MTDIDQEKQLVIQSNPLIEAQYKLDLMAQKIIRYLVSKIRPSDEKLGKDHIYTLPVSDYCKVMDREYKTKVFEDIKAAAEKLLSTKITIKRGKEVIRTTWIASYKYHMTEGWFEFSFSDHLERELLKLKDQFTQYYLKNVSKLKSSYSIRLYELLKQYVSVGQRKINIEDLRVMLGIEENEYKEFKNFKSRILKRAHAEIIQKTDIDFEFEAIKLSRKPIAILFHEIKQKTFIPDKIFALIPKKYRDSKQVLNLTRKYIEICGEDYVIEKLNYTNAKKPKKWVSYYSHTLENNYGEGYVAGQQPLPGVFEELEDGTTIEINGQKYIFNGGAIQTEKGAIPQGYLQKMLSEGKAKIFNKN